MAAQTTEEQSLNELRNTVVNLLQALVDKGVMTRDQAAALVKQAQDKAAADTAAAAKLAETTAGAVRATHVSAVVQEKITRVAQEVTPQVVSPGMETARAEQGEVPGALPDWISKVRFIGDVRVREQSDLYASDNAQETYLDYQLINDAGGIGQAGPDAFTNTSEDRNRLRVRARFGVEANPAPGVEAVIRIATGNLREAVSTNQTLANTFGRYVIGLDLAYISWNVSGSRDYPWFSLIGGRMTNPWFSTPLLYDEDLSFDGVAMTFRQHLAQANPQQRFLFLTLGGFPLQEVELSTDDKWLFGAQLGIDWTFNGGSRIQFAGAIYDYEKITGIRNAPGSKQLDYTAPQFVQRGNTLFDIRNDLDPNTNLFALAADYTVVNATGVLEVPLPSGLRLTFTGDYVRNISYDEQRVMANTGVSVPARIEGYQGEFGLGRGSFSSNGGWEAFVGYRYLQRDAVLDAFTDSDFRLGGTDVQGYYLGGTVGLTDDVWLRLRCLSGREIDGPSFAVDVCQLDANARF
jgi:Putative porin